MVMALKNLTVEEMIGMSSSWVAPGETRTLLEKHPRTAGILGDIVAAHEGLVGSQEKAQQEDQKLASLVVQQKSVDGVYDRKARGSNLLLAALAELCDDEAQARTFAEAQALLHPNGLAFINQNYAAEAGVAELTRHRLQEAPAVQALLASIPLPPGFGPTLAAEVQTWLDAGETLRKLEAERIALVDTSETASAQSPERKPQSVARNRWIRVIRLVLDQINLDESPDPELRRRVLLPVAEAEARADARAGRAVQPASPPEPPPAS